MFESIPSFWKLFLEIITALSLFIASISYLWATSKNNITKANSDTAKANAEAAQGYKLELEAVNCRVDRLENEVKTYREENIALKAENKVLNNTLNLRDPKFVTAMTEGFNAMKETLEFLKSHDVQAKEIQKDTIEIRKDSNKLLADLDIIKDFCIEAKPLLLKG